MAHLSHAIRGSRIGAAILSALVVFLAACLPAAAQDSRPLRGVALIIGQSEYEHLAPLANPSNDADAVEELFDRLGFDTTHVSDRDARRLSRDLERFLEDAEEADVAVVYYAGHGIEAGGENFLVPVDASLSALDAAAERLIPLSGFVEKLQATVPLAILLLDACRDNPFPAGATVRLDPSAAPAPMGEGGLGETRGARALSAPQTGVENHGTVIAFAAEPGKAALDGAPGENSPYAAALLRHLDAMAGEEFGLVMRMVGEEVYLKTAGRQRPWVNESLRRLLYFGAPAAALSGAEGDILAERRQLLVTIASLPSLQRARAETLAQAGGVPMSVVYAMMQALGVDPNDDPEKVEDRLRAQIEQFAALKATRAAFDGADPEIVRLTALADGAEEEGALAAADALREQAKDRVAGLRETREDQIETLRRRIAEDAEVYARSAETKKLMFRHAAAADDYAEAAEMMARWDDGIAAIYRNSEIAARLADAELRGTPASLDAAEAKARQALSTMPDTAGVDAVRLGHALGQALMLRSERRSDPAPLREALAIQREAAAGAQLLEPAERARVLIDAGRAAGQSGLVTANLELLAEAERYFAQAATTAEAASLAALLIEARFRVLQATYVRWSAAPDAALWARMAEEVTRIVELLDAGEPDAFSARYIVKAVHMALDLALRQNTPDALSVATEMTSVAMEIFDAGRFPLVVAEIDALSGRIALEWAERFGDYSMLLHGLELQRKALHVYAEAGAGNQRREAEWHLALTLAAIGTREPSDDRLVEAIGIMERLQSEPQIQSNRAQMQALAFQLARLRGDLAYREGDEQALRRQVTALEAIHAAAADPVSKTQAAIALGRLQYHLAGFTQSAQDYRASVATLQGAIGQHDQWRSDLANPGPYSELYAVYSDAAAGLAFASAAPDDVTHAVAANERMFGLFRQQANHGGMVAVANLIGHLATQALQRRFDAGTYALAQRHLDEAEGFASGDPDRFGPLRRSRCLLELAHAAHEQTAGAAGHAVSLCAMSLDNYETFGPETMIDAATSSLEEAERLAERTR